jgi:hypothetical protein
MRKNKNVKLKTKLLVLMGASLYAILPGVLTIATVTKVVNKDNKRIERLEKRIEFLEGKVIKFHIEENK